MSEQEEATNLKMKLFNVIMAESASKRIACIALCNLFVQIVQQTNSDKQLFMQEMQAAWDYHADK